MGSACGSIGGLFGSKQTTQQQNAQQSSGQTTSNFMPQLQEAFGTLQSQYSNLGNMGANPWQTGAADAQMGVAGNLQPAYGAAGQVAQGGIGDVSRYMSPYIQNVVNATRADFAAQNARDLSNVNAQGAKLGSVTGTGRVGALQQAREAQMRTQDPVIANLYNQGFMQSGQLAQADAAARISGANSIGALIGANTQANLGLGSIGQQVQQSNLSPYALANQYATGTAGLANAAGQNVTSSSSGTSSGTQEGSQGAGTIAAGLLGSYLMGRKAHGGAVTGDADGNGIMDRYEKTLASLHRMHGGSIPGLQAFQDGGRPKFQDPNDNDPGTPPTTNIAPRPQIGMEYGPPPQIEAPRMDLGGPQPQASSGFDFGSLLPSYDHGVWQGEKPSSMQTLGYALTQIGDKNPFAGFGAAAFNQYNEEAKRRQQRDMQAKQLAQQAQIALGQINGQKTLAAQQFQEAQREHDKPTWGVIGVDQYGNSQYGFIRPSSVMPPRPGAAQPQASAPSAPPDYASAPPPPRSSGVTQGNELPQSAILPSPYHPNRGSQTLSGDEFLKTLDPQDAVMVKRIAEGDAPYPVGMGAQKGRGAFLAQAVLQYDPTFDVKDFQARQKLMTSLKAGKIGEQVKSLNTAAGHLDDLDKAIDKLENWNVFPAVTNTARGAVFGQTSKEYQDARAAFDTKRKAVAGELAKVFRSEGMSVQEINEWLEQLQGNHSDAYLKSGVRTAVQLIDARMKAIEHQWKDSFKGKPLTAISPEARATYDRLGRLREKVDGGKLQARLPQVGDVEDGHRFKGGDPREKSNWEKVE